MNQSFLIEQIANENNIKNAWIKVNYHARTSLEYFDQYAYDEFEENLDLNLEIIRQQLINQEYKFDNLRIFEMPKGEDKRKIYFLTPKDGIVAQALINIVAPIFESQFSTHSFGNRISYASSENKNPLLDWYDQYLKYINHILSTLELPSSYWYQITDIANYYPSINKTKLLSKLTLKLHDSGALRLIEQLLSLNAINLSEQKEVVQGLPPGTVYSHFFANVYLDDFDKYIEQFTVVYARYVDDMCFVVKSEEELIELNKKIVMFFGDLGNLFLKESKTESYSIAESLALIEHTRKLKYDLRFGIVETLKNSIELNELQVTERIFHNLFLRVEKEEDISRVVENIAGFIATGFDKLSIDSQLAVNIAFGILLRKPQKITAVRALTGYLMGFFMENPNQRFLDFIKDSPDVIKITFLQLLHGHSEVHGAILDFLFALKNTSENYLIKANVYTVLSSLHYSFPSDEYNDLVIKENSDYVLARLIQCISSGSKNENVWADLRQTLENHNELVLRSVIYACHKINYQDDDWVGTKILFPVLLSHPASDLFSLTFLLKLASQFGDYESLKQVHGMLFSIGSEVGDILFRLSWINVFLYLTKQKNDYGRLITYLDSLKKLDVDIDYFSGYQEVLINTTETDFSMIDQPSTLGSFPEWYSQKLLQIDKGLYCEHLIHQNYSSRHFQDGETRGVLEIIPLELIVESKQFNNSKDWMDYL